MALKGKKKQRKIYASTFGGGKPYFERFMRKHTVVLMTGSGQKVAMWKKPSGERDSQMRWAFAMPAPQPAPAPEPTPIDPDLPEITIREIEEPQHVSSTESAPPSKEEDREGYRQANA